MLYSNLKVFIWALVHKVWLHSEICFVSHRVMGRLQQEWPLQLTCSCHRLPIMFISVVKVMGQACLWAIALYRHCEQECVLWISKDTTHVCRILSRVLNYFAYWSHWTWINSVWSRISHYKVLILDVEHLNRLNSAINISTRSDV